LGAAGYWCATNLFAPKFTKKKVDMILRELDNLTGNFIGTVKTPALFIGHGNPMNALYDNTFTRSLNNLGVDIKNTFKLNAILVVSAHWLTNGTFVNVSKKPEIIYDFGGFPDELFHIKYPATGSPEYAHEVNKIIPLVRETAEWGIDHGSWTVLKHLFPLADIPVFQLSIDYHKPMQYHFDLAKQLKSLREKGVMIIGSGNIVHNLRLSFQTIAQQGEDAALDWAIEFDEWAKQKIDSRDFGSLINFESAGEIGKLAIPTVDHYVPMLYSLALAEKNEPIIYTHEEVTFGAMSMRCFRVG
jgi:4,5-DOPA dioxygenase extradiol